MAVAWVLFKAGDATRGGALPRTDPRAGTYGTFVHRDVLDVFNDVAVRGQCSMHSDVPFMCKCYDVPEWACHGCQLAFNVVADTDVQHVPRCPCTGTALYGKPCHTAVARACKNAHSAVVRLNTRLPGGIRAADVDHLASYIQILVEWLEACRGGAREDLNLTPEKERFVSAFAAPHNITFDESVPWQAFARAQLLRPTIYVGAALKF